MNNIMVNPKMTENNQNETENTKVNALFFHLITENLVKMTEMKPNDDFLEFLEAIEKICIDFTLG